MLEDELIGHEFRCETVADTQRIGESLGERAKAGDVILLNGPLGAGKTTMTSGIARGMGVKGRVSSPTFTIARVHRSAGDGPQLIHVDAYRLRDSAEDPHDVLESLDLDWLVDTSVIVAEWGTGLLESLAPTYYLVDIDRERAVREDPDSEARYVTVTLHQEGEGCEDPRD